MSSFLLEALANDEKLPLLNLNSLDYDWKKFKTLPTKVNNAPEVLAELIVSLCDLQKKNSKSTGHLQMIANIVHYPYSEKQCFLSKNFFVWFKTTYPDYMSSYSGMCLLFVLQHTPHNVSQHIFAEYAMGCYLSPSCSHLFQVVCSLLLMEYAECLETPVCPSLLFMLVQVLRKDVRCKRYIFTDQTPNGFAGYFKKSTKTIQKTQIFKTKQI